MKATKTTSAVLLVIAVMAACSQKNRKAESDERIVNSSKSNSESSASRTIGNSVSIDSISVYAGLPGVKDVIPITNLTGRQFIKTAHLMFEVKNVEQATYAVEDIAARYGGFVTHSNLLSSMDNKTITAVSVDSSVECARYTVKNDVQLRVPNAKVDSVMRELSGLETYLDNRSVTANDVSLQLLTNQFLQNRMHASNQRLTNDIDEHTKSKLEETTAAEDKVLNNAEQRDNAKISSLNLLDNVGFATINIAVYQPQVIRYTMFANAREVKPYEPSFFIQLKDALNYGWEIVEYILLAVAKLWGLLVLGLLIYVFYARVIAARLKTVQGKP